MRRQVALVHLPFYSAFALFRGAAAESPFVEKDSKMSNPITLKSEPRSRVGKGSSRALRRAGQIPAVIYGEKQEPLAIALPFKQVHLQIHAGGFLTKIMVIEHNGEQINVLPRDYQLDVIKDMPMHVDFLRISEKSRVTVEVPVHFLGQEECKGLAAGGVLNIIYHTIEMEVPATAIPESIEVDISAMEIGDSVHISAVKIPAKCELINEEDFALATISAPVEEEEEETAEAAPAEGEGAAAPAEGEEKEEEKK